MIRAYLANGVLASVLRAQDNTVGVDSGLYSYIASLLGSNYCYLVINGIEIVKVLGTALPNLLLIQRNSLSRKIWLPGTPILYQLTPNEIQDSISEKSLSLAEDGRININRNKISYPEITLDTVGGIKASELPKVIIEDIPVAACGCEAPPEIPVNFLKIRIVDGGYRITDDGKYRVYA